MSFHDPENFFILQPHIKYTGRVTLFYCLLNFKPTVRSSNPEVFLGKYVLKICGKFTGEDQRRSAISRKLQSNFMEMTLRHGCSTANFLFFSEHFS